ncbi:hypothetical protein KCP78_24260 [Salmonella enterica subsp. enterica]|nr:hypothetical protein KCP78_24260 [Salmonella enterica subsp. enterica]
MMIYMGASMPSIIRQQQDNACYGKANARNVCVGNIMYVEPKRYGRLPAYIQSRS